MRAERRWVGAGVAAVAPWTWFVVRDRTLLFDVVATGLPVLFPAVALGIGVYAAVRKRRLLIIGVVSWLVAGALAVVGPWRPQPVPSPVGGFRVVAANVNSRNPTIGRAVADAVGRGGDLVLLIEAGKGRWTPPPEYTTVIRPQYSAQVILSRFPARLLDKPAGWPKDFRAHRLEVEAPTGRIVVYLAHLKRPHLGPGRILGIRGRLQVQRRERESLLRSARAEKVPGRGGRRLQHLRPEPALPADHVALPGRHAGRVGRADLREDVVAAFPPADRPHLRAPQLVLGPGRAVCAAGLRPSRPGRGRRAVPRCPVTPFL